MNFSGLIKNQLKLQEREGKEMPEKREMTTQ